MCKKLNDSVLNELSNKLDRESIVRINLDYYDREEIDKFREENKLVTEFSGFIFKYEKGQIKNKNSISSRFQLIDNFEERKQVFYDTLVDAHSDRLSYVSKDKIQKKLIEYPQYSKNGEMYKFSGKNGTILGVVFFLETDYMGEKVKLLAWIWKNKNISKDDSLEFDENFKAIVASLSLPLISSVEKENVRSLNFHRRMGFKEKWLIYRF